MAALYSGAGIAVINDVDGFRTDDAGCGSNGQKQHQDKRNDPTDRACRMMIAGSMIQHKKPPESSTRQSRVEY